MAVSTFDFPLPPGEGLHWKTCERPGSLQSSQHFLLCPGLREGLIISGMPLLGRIHGFLSECFPLRERKSIIERLSCRLPAPGPGQGEKLGKGPVFWAAVGSRTDLGVGVAPRPPLGRPGVPQVEDNPGGPGAQERKGREESLVRDWPLAFEVQMQWDPLALSLGLWALT